MKKTQFAILIAVIVLCAGGIFGYVKYRLDNQEVNNNQEINNNSSVDNKNENKNNKLYTLEEMNDYLSNLSYDQSSLMKKYNVSKKLVLRESESNSIFGVYINNNTKQVLEPTYVPNNYMDGNQTMEQALVYYSNEIYNNTILKHLDYMDRYYNLYELKDVNSTSNYLVILCDSAANGGKVFIYDSNLNAVGNFDYMGSLYGITFIENGLSVLETDKGFNNIEFNNNNIIALEFVDNNQLKVNKVKYTINNGVLNRTVLEELEMGKQIGCAGCR